MVREPSRLLLGQTSAARRSEPHLVDICTSLDQDVRDLWMLKHSGHIGSSKVSLLLCLGCGVFAGFKEQRIAPISPLQPIVLY